MTWALYETIYRGEVTVPNWVTFGLTEAESHQVRTEWLDDHDAWPRADEVVEHEFQPRGDDDSVTDPFALEQIQAELAEVEKAYATIQATLDDLGSKRAALTRYVTHLQHS